MTLLISPPPRWSAVMAELPTSNEVILMCGKTTANIYNGNSTFSGLLNDVWKWDGVSWSNISTGYTTSQGSTILTGPSPRFEATCSFDGTYITMVGGADLKENLSDIWSYNVSAGLFKQPITPTNTGVIGNPPSYNVFNQPVLLRGACMAYQSGVGGGQCLLGFGEAQYQRHYSLDLWQYVSGNPGTFTIQSPTSWPNARKYAAMASSPTTALMVGGKDFSGPLFDQWTHTSSGWSQITGLTPGVNCPSARYGHSLIYDASTSSYILFGGITAGGNFSSETWKYTSGTWSNVSPITSPPPRAFAAMAYNSHTSNSVLFSGLGYQYSYLDTWVYNSTLNTWVQQ